jgi:hypothetical protein
MTKLSATPNVNISVWFAHPAESKPALADLDRACRSFRDLL